MGKQDTCNLREPEPLAADTGNATRSEAGKSRHLVRQGSEMEVWVQNVEE